MHTVGGFFGNKKANAIVKVKVDDSMTLREKAIDVKESIKQKAKQTDIARAVRKLSHDISRHTYDGEQCGVVLEKDPLDLSSEKKNTMDCMVYVTCENAKLIRERLISHLENSTDTLKTIKSNIDEVKTLLEKIKEDPTVKKSNLTISWIAAQIISAIALMNTLEQQQKSVVNGVIELKDDNMIEIWVELKSQKNKEMTKAQIISLNPKIGTFTIQYENAKSKKKEFSDIQFSEICVGTSSAYTSMTIAKPDHSCEIRPAENVGQTGGHRNKNTSESIFFSSDMRKKMLKNNKHDGGSVSSISTGKLC